MVIPKNDPLYSEDGRPFQDKMAEYIAAHWGRSLIAGRRAETPKGPAQHQAATRSAPATAKR